MRTVVLDASVLLVAATASAEGTKDGQWLRWHGPMAGVSAPETAHVDDQGFVELPGRHLPAPIRAPRERAARRRPRQDRPGSKWNHGRKDRRKFRPWPISEYKLPPREEATEPDTRESFGGRLEEWLLELKAPLLLDRLLQEKDLVGETPEELHGRGKFLLDIQAEADAIANGFNI